MTRSMQPKDKAQKLEANTPQPAATAAETVKTAPGNTTNRETVAETSTEEKTPKRGRKPGSKKVTAKTEEQPATEAEKKPQKRK